MLGNMECTPVNFVCKCVCKEIVCVCVSGCMCEWMCV